MFAVAVATLTISRSFDKSNPLVVLMNTVVSYFCGGIRVLNQTIAAPGQYGLDSYSFGICTFGGLVSILDTFNHYILGLFGVSILPKGFSTSIIHNAYLSKNIRIGTHSSMNAFPTMLYYFMRDGGLLWVILFTFIFCRIIMRTESNFLRCPTVKNSFLLYLLIYNVVMSVCWWNPINCEFWMELFWGLLIIEFLLVKGRTSQSSYKMKKPMNYYVEGK